MNNFMKFQNNVQENQRQKSSTPINKANKKITQGSSYPTVDEPDDEDFEIPDEDIAINSLSCVSCERDSVGPISKSKALYISNSLQKKSIRCPTNMSVISKNSTSI